MTSRSARPCERRRASERLLLALLLLLRLLETTPASAQPLESLELQWLAPAGCPDASEVRGRVERLVGSAEITGAPLRAEGTVTRRHDGSFHLRLVIRVDDLAGEREIEGAACRDLGGAAAVALALLLRSAEPLTAGELSGDPATSEASSGESSRSVPAALESSPARVQVESAGTRSARAWRGLFQVPLARVGFGPVSAPGFGLALAAGASIGRWLFLADGEAWLPQQVSTLHQAERYRADLQRFAVGLRACRSLLGPRFDVAPCVAITTAHMSARGTGWQVAPDTAAATWVALGVGAQTRIYVTRWLGLLAGMDVQFQTSRPEIAIEGVGTIDQLLPVAITATVGSEWIL